jgi:hypothetical protein
MARLCECVLKMVNENVRAKLLMKMPRLCECRKLSMSKLSVILLQEIFRRILGKARIYKYIHTKHNNSALNIKLLQFKGSNLIHQSFAAEIKR